MASVILVPKRRPRTLGQATDGGGFHWLGGASAGGGSRGSNVDEQDLPEGLGDLGRGEGTHERSDSRTAGANGALGPRGLGETGFNGPNGPRGVCRAGPVEAGEPSAQTPVTAAPVRFSDPFAFVTPQPQKAGPKIGPVAQASPAAPSGQGYVQPSVSSAKPTGPKIGPADPANIPCVKLRGMTHPWKPRTPAQIAEFAAHWHNTDLSIPSIAKRYKASTRSIHKWRIEMGLQRRDVLRELGTQAATVAEAAGRVVADMAESAKVSERMLQAQAVLGIELGLKAAATSAAAARGELVALADGTLIDPQVVRNWNPLKDEEIAALVDEVHREARQITQHSDLTALQRKLAKVSILVSTKMPVYTWESLQTILDGLSRTVLWARKVEADIPQSGADPVLLRQEAGRQLFRELRDVLSKEDQEALAVIVKRGADAIMARKATTPAATNGLRH